MNEEKKDVKKVEEFVKLSDLTGKEVSKWVRFPVKLTRKTIRNGINATMQIIINQVNLIIPVVSTEIVSGSRRRLRYYKPERMVSLLFDLNLNQIIYNFKITKLIDDTTPFRIISDNDLKKLGAYLYSLNLNETNNLVWVTSIFLALDTGARKNELLNIKTKDIDFERNVIYLETCKNFKRIVKFGKLSSEYVKKIFNKNNEYLLHNRLRNEKINKKSLEWFFAKLNKSIEFDDGNISLHRIRKTFATKLYLNGCPLPTIQKILGHQDIRMTMKYIDVSSLTMLKHYDEYYPYE